MAAEFSPVHLRYLAEVAPQRMQLVQLKPDVKSKGGPITNANHFISNHIGVLSIVLSSNKLDVAMCVSPGKEDNDPIFDSIETLVKFHGLTIRVSHEVGVQTEHGALQICMLASRVHFDQMTTTTTITNVWRQDNLHRRMQTTADQPRGRRSRSIAAPSSNKAPSAKPIAAPSSKKAPSAKPIAASSSKDERSVKPIAASSSKDASSGKPKDKGGNSDTDSRKRPKAASCPTLYTLAVSQSSASAFMLALIAKNYALVAATAKYVHADKADKDAAAADVVLLLGQDAVAEFCRNASEVMRGASEVMRVVHAHTQRPSVSTEPLSIDARSLCRALPGSLTDSFFVVVEDSTLRWRQAKELGHLLATETEWVLGEKVGSRMHVKVVYLFDV